MKCNVSVAEAINDEGVLPERVQEALGQLVAAVDGQPGSSGWSSLPVPASVLVLVRGRRVASVACFAIARAAEREGRRTRLACLSLGDARAAAGAQSRFGGGEGAGWG